MAPQASDRKGAANATAKWAQHERMAQAVQNDAKRLVAHAGTAQQAKQAIDAAAHQPSPAASRKDLFARERGFTSYLELFEASTVVRTTDGKHWFVTALPGKQPAGEQWMLWNEEDLSAHSLHGSLEAAQQQISAG